MPLPEIQGELRSPEMHEVVGQVPSSIVRWGITVIFLVILTLLLVSWFIRYPDLLSAKIIITTTPPPLTLVSRTSGNLKLLKKDNEVASTGEVVAYMQANALPAAVLSYEKLLMDDDNLPPASLESLGDLQLGYRDWVNATIALQNFHSNKTYDVQINQLNRQVNTYEKLGTSLEKQQKLQVQELALAKEKFKTDSVLYYQKVTSAIDFNSAQTTWLQQQRNARNAEMAMINNEAQINLVSKQIADLEIQKQEQKQKLELEKNQNRQLALAQIIKWKENYLFVAPSNGRLSYLGFLEEGQFLEASKSCFSIVPNEGHLVARAELPLRGSGKVKEGQAVNIRLENYPFEQFGLLRGTVASISMMPGEDKYWVTISLPDQLLTSQNKLLPFKQQLTGTTEIITEDLRLMERFFYQFRKLVQAR